MNQKPTKQYIRNISIIILLLIYKYLLFWHENEKTWCILFASKNNAQYFFGKTPQTTRKILWKCILTKHFKNFTEWKLAANNEFAKKLPCQPFSDRFFFKTSPRSWDKIDTRGSHPKRTRARRSASTTSAALLSKSRTG